MGLAVDLGVRLRVGNRGASQWLDHRSIFLSLNLAERTKAKILLPPNFGVLGKSPNRMNLSIGRFASHNHFSYLGLM